MTGKKFDGLLLLQLSIAILIFIISIYGLVSENFSLFPLMYLFMSAMFILIGLREYKRTKSLFWGIFYWCVALIMLVTAIQGILIN